MAASVRTRVVSWKDAAEMKLSVVNAARVMPRSTGLAIAGLPPLATNFSFSSANTNLSTWLPAKKSVSRSEEHTSELQSRLHLVCRLLLEKKKKTHILLHGHQQNACINV